MKPEDLFRWGKLKVIRLGYHSLSPDNHCTIEPPVVWVTIVVTMSGRARDFQFKEEENDIFALPHLGDLINLPPMETTYRTMSGWEYSHHFLVCKFCYPSPNSTTRMILINLIFFTFKCPSVSAIVQLWSAVMPSCIFIVSNLLLNPHWLNCPKTMLEIVCRAEAVCDTSSADQDDMKQIYIHDDDRVLIKVRSWCQTNPVDKFERQKWLKNQVKLIFRHSCKGYLENAAVVLNVYCVSIWFTTETFTLAMFWL